MQTRVFTFKGQTLPDIDPNMTPDEIKAAYASKHGELTTAAVQPKGEKDGKAVFEFVVSTGKKG